MVGLFDVERFYRDVLHALGEHAQRGGTAWGAASVVKRVGREHGVVSAEYTPLPRPSRAEREEAHSPCDCSGELGCKVEAVTMADWNSSAPQRWSWFMTEMRRPLERRVQFCGSWEVQSRGALHRHTLMWCPAESPPSDFEPPCGSVRIDTGSIDSTTFR